MHPSAMRHMLTSLTSLLLVLCHVRAPSNDARPPRSWYRFEDPSNLGKDEMGFHDLSRASCISLPANRYSCGRNMTATTSPATPVLRGQSNGGVVGSYIQLDGSAAAENSSWLMNASVLPTQCSSTFFTRDDGSYLGPTCPRNDKMLCSCTGSGGRMHAPAEHVCSNSSSRRCIRGITIEFLLRPGHDAMRQGNVTLFEARGPPMTGSIWVDLSRHGISFRAAHTNRAGGSTGDDEEMIRPRWNGTGVASPEYLFDNQWHHLVFRRDVFNNELSIWIDGQNPQTGGRCELGIEHKTADPLMCWQARGNASHDYMNNLTFGAGGIGSLGGMRPPLLVLPTAFDGSIDEIALYEYPLSDDLIYAHYTQAILENTKYRFDELPPPAPAPVPIHGAFELREYAPGTILPSPAKGNPVTQGVRVSPLQQMLSWPAPRYHAPPARDGGSGPAEGLQALGVSWVSDYLAGSNQPPQPWSNNTDHMSEVTAIEETAAAVFGYSIYDGMNWNCQNVSDNNCSIGVSKPWANKTRFLLSKYPKIAWEVSFLRSLQINQSLPDSCYLTNNRSQFIAPTGVPVRTGGERTLRPLLAATAEKVGCQYALWNLDGRNQNQGLRVAERVFERSVDRLWDDAEFTYIHGKINVYGPLDPAVVQSYEESGIRDWPDGTRDWDTYFSRWYAEFKSSYRDALLQGFPETLYSEYGFGGNFLHRLWSEVRTVFSPMPPPRRSQRYSTQSLYGPESGPAGWDEGFQGALDQLQVMRPEEFAVKDFLNAPFVAAGWKWQEEKTFRPAQYLGWLKLLAAMGAEYYTVGYFNGRHPSINESDYSCLSSNCAEADCCPFQLAQNYVWQIAMPAYAQATTSLWSEILFNGELLIGDMPMARTEQNCDHPICDYSAKFPQKKDAQTPPNYTHWLTPINWRFWAGSQDIAVFVRKHIQQSIYVLVGSVQPQSNYVGNINIAVNATIRLTPSVNITFEVRRQGSTYLLTMEEEAASGDGSALAGASTEKVKSFLQLDGWHSSWHPSFWSQEFSVEGELHDHASSSMMTTMASTISDVRTENILRIDGTADSSAHYDMRDAVSFVRMSGKDRIAWTWTFEPRPADPVTGASISVREYAIVLRARAAVLAGSKKAGKACIDLAVARGVRSSHPQATIDLEESLSVAAPLGHVCLTSNSSGNGDGAWVECMAFGLPSPMSKGP
eukprot:COSAG06_NODE_2806_length_6257_cov_1.915557_5_plen_1190_part_01